MRIPVEWVGQYLERKLDAQTMAQALELAGIEVDAIIPAVKLDPKIVVGFVQEVKPHPDADKLRIALIDVKKATLEIVCGASNIAKGQHVAVAQVGALLPDTTKIEAAKIRGIESQGMVCSEQELGLGDNHSGIMVLDGTPDLGIAVNTVLGASDVIDATTAANRWDLNSFIGIAREAAAHSGSEIVVPSGEQLSDSNPNFEVTIEAVELVDRYMLARLSVDVTKPTPDWMNRRLQAAGLRSVNLVVDITNYVMLEQGQPLHAFDVAKLNLPVRVRTAERGEQLTTLDGNSRKLSPEDLLIADSEGPIGIAGVMGGEYTEISDKTSEIYLEAASFNGPTLRKSAQRHGLRTDASARFERRIPVEASALALERAVGLLKELADAQLMGSIFDSLEKPTSVPKITVRSGRISGILGLALSSKQIARELVKLGFETGPTDREDQLTVTVPWWRPDVATEEDIAEEVMKLEGYEKLPAKLPAWRPTQIRFDSHWSRLWQAKNVLRSRGLFEVVTYSFISESQIEAIGGDTKRFLKLKNPLSSEQAYLRTSLLPSLISVVESNRTYSKNCGVYEFSKVYDPRRVGDLPKEHQHLGVLVRAERDSYRVVKAALDQLAGEFNSPVEVVPDPVDERIVYPGRGAKLRVGGKDAGWIGQLHPELASGVKGGELAYLELSWEQFTGASQVKSHRNISRYPSVSRDLSVVVDREVSWAQVEAALTGYEVKFLSDYYGEDLAKGKKALAMRLTFSEPDRTLTDSEADSQLNKASELLAKAFNASLRT